MTTSQHSSAAPRFTGAGVARAEPATVLEQAALARVLRGILTFVFGAAIVFAVVAGLEHDYSPLLASSVTAGAVPVLRVLLRRGRVSAAAAGVSLLLLGDAVYVVLTGRGVFDPGMLLLPVAILVGALTADRRAAVGIAILTVLTALGVGVVSRLRLHDSPVAAYVLRSDLFYVTLLLSMTALVVHAVTRSLHAGLAQAIEAERSYREIFAATHDAIMVHDPVTGKVLDANESALRISGRSRDQFVGRKFDDYGTNLAGSPFTPEVALVHLRKAMTEGPQVFEWHWRGTDGRDVWLEVALRRAVISSREVVLAVVRDRTEMRELAERLREAERLQSLGRLAGGVAHDFNNQLTGILASASLLELDLTQQPRSLGHVRVIKQCARHAADLTRNLLAFAQKGVHQHVPVDLGATIAGVLEQLGRFTDEGVVVERVLPSEAAFTRGDRGLLHSAVLNLAINGCEAMPHGGRLTIALERRRLEAPTTFDDGQVLPAGAYHVVRVSDTGQGMDEATRRRVFEPFFTTKATGHGMGLAAVYGTVQSHGGRVTVSSAEGQGATFELWLPALDPPADPPADPPVLAVVTRESSAAAAEAQGLAHRRVLLVEDEPLVAESGAMLLRRLGCAVEVSGDGDAALERLAAAPRDFDAVILDHGLPRRTGSSVLRELRARGYRVPVLLTSGNPSDLEAGALDDAQGFLPKPYTLSQLSAAVRGAMGVT